MSCAVSVTMLMAWLPACGGGGGSTPSTTSPQVAPTLQLLSVGDLGPVLADGLGETVYVNTSFHGDAAGCNASCLSVWPPILDAPGLPPILRDGLPPGAVGSRITSGGRSELTFHGYLLHTYVGDSVPKQANGEGTQHLWFTISGAGRPVRAGR